MPKRSLHAEGSIYRGVHAHHPSYASALTGVIVPGNIEGRVTPEQHNVRDSSSLSPYTSWTHDRQIAINFANSRGPGGLLLELPIGAPAKGDTWRWEMSPDAWLEDEVLLYGVRMGAKVTKL